MEVGKIIKGHINELLGLNKDLVQIRLKICKECPLYSNNYGGQCNPRLYMNPDTKDVSVVKKDGYYSGCGCRINAKATLPEASCPVKQW